jgi:hypothetical protein
MTKKFDRERVAKMDSDSGDDGISSVNPRFESLLAFYRLVLAMYRILSCRDPTPTKFQFREDQARWGSIFKVAA